MAINGMLTGISDMYGIFMADKDITGYHWLEMTNPQLINVFAVCETTPQF